MKILMPFPYLEIFDRHYAQLKAIAQRLDTFYIAYTSGQPKPEWNKHFIFYKFWKHPYNSSHIGWKKKIWKSWSYLHKLFLSKRLFSQLSSHMDVDLCYTYESFWQSGLALKLAGTTGIPCVIRVRADIPFYLNLKYSFLVRTFYLRSILHNLQTSTMVIPITTQVRNSLIAQGLSKEKLSQPIGLGVDTFQFHPMKTNSGEAFTVGYAGRFSEEKGVVRLIDLANQLPKIKFLLAGRKQMPLAFPANMNYLGRIPHEKMAEFYNRCDLIVLPSFTEGFPNTVVEAYACCKPILVTPQVLPEELALFGYTKAFPYWKETIENIDTQELEILGKYARSYVEKTWTWQKFGERMFKCLSSVG